ASRCGRVVGGGRGGAVCGGVRDVHGLVVCARQRHRERRARRPGVAFFRGHVADGDERRLVVRDGGRALGSAGGPAGRAAQVDDEGLVRLGEKIAVDRHGNGRARLAGDEGQGAARSLVVAAGNGAAVGGGIGDGDRLFTGGK